MGILSKRWPRINSRHFAHSSLDGTHLIPRRIDLTGENFGIQGGRPDNERDLRKYSACSGWNGGGCNRPAQTRTEPAVAAPTPSSAAESPRDFLLLRQNLAPRRDPELQIQED
jgi:hypothetical protein